jgi:hypothetical protein
MVACGRFIDISSGSLREASLMLGRSKVLSYLDFT